MLRIGDAIETGLTGFTEEDLTLYLFDVTSNNEIAFLYTRPRTASNTSELPTNTHSLEKGLHLKTKINFGGRQWKFIVVPTNEFIESQKSKASWVVLFVGLCLTIVTMMYLSNRLKHITEIELRVQRETAAKERLSKEIRERKNAQETSARYGKILEQSLNEIYIINEHSYNFVVVNKGARKNLGYSIDELKKLTPIDIKPEYTIESFAKLITPLRNREKDIVLFHTVHKRKDGSLYNVEVHLQLMKFESESVFVAIINDITEKLKTEEELRQSHKMESIGTLAGGIAHDFNNVLSSIIGFTELALEEAVQGSTLEEYLHEVFSAGNRAKDLVWQILTFARQTDEPIKPIDIDNIANEVLKFIRSTIPSTIEIKQHIESESLILGNPTQTHQVILNLCTNAAQAMDEAGGILEVTLKDVTIDRNSLLFKEGLTLGNYIEIKISDTGPGIPSDIISSIFEPYFTTKDPGEGTGMGLAVVQGIIEKNRGKISVESQLGKGTTFKVYLPVTKKRQAQPLYEPERLPTGTESILFVDDEASVANMTTRILESLGYSVTTRTSSVEALELFISKPNSFDLVITDMTMPNLTGDALAVQLMTINPDISVILCTGYSKRISKESAAEIGIKAFAYKPIVKADLAKTVRKILDESKG